MTKVRLHSGQSSAVPFRFAVCWSWFLRLSVRMMSGFTPWSLESTDCVRAARPFGLEPRRLVKFALDRVSNQVCVLSSRDAALARVRGGRSGISGRCWVKRARELSTRTQFGGPSRSSGWNARGHCSRGVSPHRASRDGQGTGGLLTPERAPPEHLPRPARGRQLSSWGARGVSPQVSSQD